MDTHRNIHRILSIISVILLSFLACTALTDSQDSNDEWVPVCTPPACARNENFACQGDCPGGCGTFCAMFTPAPSLYPAVELAGVNLSDHTLEIIVDVPGLEGDFYGVVLREDFECSIRQPEHFPNRLYCAGNLWSSEGTQTLRVYRIDDNRQAFTLDFLLP